MACVGAGGRACVGAGVRRTLPVAGRTAGGRPCQWEWIEWASERHAPFRVESTRQLHVASDDGVSAGTTSSTTVATATTATTATTHRAGGSRRLGYVGPAVSSVYYGE